MLDRNNALNDIIDDLVLDLTRLAQVEGFKLRYYREYPDEVRNLKFCKRLLNVLCCTFCEDLLPQS